MTEIHFAALVTKMRKPSHVALQTFTQSLVKLMLAGAKSSGFWSAEIDPPADVETGEWTLRLLYRTSEEADVWRNSEKRKETIAELRSMLNVPEFDILEEVEHSRKNTEIATAIVTNLREDQENAYFAWQEKIQSAQAAFPGYRGAYIQPPIPGRPKQWSTLLRFNSPEHLENWFESPERNELLQEAKKFVKVTRINEVKSTFPGWFLTDSHGKGPPNWKTAQLVFLGLLPIVALEIKFLNPLYQDLNKISAMIGIFLSLFLSVSCVSYVTMPLLIRIFNFWLYQEKRTMKVDLIGQAGVFAIIFIELACLWRLI